MKPVSVLSVIHPFRPAFSGEGEWWLRMIPFLRARGVEVEILTSGRSQGVTQARPDRVDGVPVHRLPIATGKSAYWRSVRGIITALDALLQHRKRFDLMLFHAPNHDTVYASCLAGRVFGWKTIYKMTLLGSDDLEAIARSGRLGRLRLAALTLADGFISMSRVLVHPYEDRPWIRTKLLVVPQGVDLERFHPADPLQKRAVRHQLGVPAEARLVLFCGAVIYRKGIDLLVDAWARVSRQVPNALLLIVGPNHLDGLEEPEYRDFSTSIAQRIQDLKLTGSVRLLGYQPHMDRYYAAADVFVFPSRSEGWGAVITEAMASGLPCVVSFLHGISEEHLQDGVEGLVVRSEASQDYADRLMTLLRDREGASLMGMRARRRAEERFAIERVADQYAAFFHRMAAGEPGIRGGRNPLIAEPW